MRENHKRLLYMGIDTSAYTTSLALVDRSENLVLDSRLPLPVKEGGLGLRQSEAVFAHLQNLPRLLESEEAASALQNGVLSAVAVSARPRPVKESYMPVFKVGEAFGLFLARTGGLAYLSSTHQEGHVMAGLWSAGPSPGRYLVVHLSGGTTEFLCAEEQKPGHLSLQLLGGGADLNAGQFIDRVGRVLGLGFPAGPELENLALQGRTGAVKLAVAVKGGEVSFSGPASQAERLLDRDCRKEDLARAVEVCIADSISRVVDNLMVQPGPCRGILAVGGVTANRFIKKRLAENLPQWELYFADPGFSSDNAAGLAVQALRCRGG